jgi:anti-sigma regulatory factor (Ser/Thr protein kinase)
MAVEHAQLVEQRRMVEALQRVLLPRRLPRVPGMQLNARYRPATVGARVGGDWFDAFTLGGGQVGLAIGDVVGTGIAAAALMSQLRTAMRAYALDGHPPATVLDRMNRLLEDEDPPKMTTAVYMILDPQAETLRVAGAGHIPPLVISPEGTASFLPTEGDPPLGVSPVATYREHTIDAPTGTRVVLVTDGAIEVPGEPLEAGMERLRGLAEEIDDGEALCAAIAGGTLTNREHGDDVAVVSAVAVPLPDVLHTNWPADAQVLAPMRHLLRRWLMRWGASRDEIYDITVAVQEACANAVEHAYAPGPAAFELEASYDDGEISAMITDHGGWRDPRGVNRGRGLPMMEALMDSVDVRRDERGTTVVLRRRLKVAQPA